MLYSFTEDGNGDGYFKIDKLTGTIRTTKALDFEERQIHSLNIKAVDKGSPSLSSETTITVEVIDVNENRFAPQFDDFVFTGKILENQPIGTHVLKLLAVDNDAPGPDSRVSYSIRGGDGLGLFAIDDEGKFKLNLCVHACVSYLQVLFFCVYNKIRVLPLFKAISIPA